jgi:hypothetical protein
MSSLNPLNPINHLPDFKTDKWYGFLIKPALMIFVFVVFSYATLWLSQHFVTQDKFAVYVEREIENDKHVAEESQKRFEVTQTKLETIINNQSIFSEDLKHINQIESGLDKRMDNLDQRLIYIERKVGSSVSQTTPTEQ